MNIPDPVTTGLVVASAVQGVKQVQDFVAALAGHPGETIGTILGNLAHRRGNNVEAVTGKAHFTLLNIGVAPCSVPLNVLQPLLEGASLQDEPDMQDVWANLLANAADPREKNRVLPSFSLILKELTWRDARFLDNFYERYHGKENDPRDALGFWNSFEQLAELYPPEGMEARALDDLTPEEQAAPGYLSVTAGHLGAESASRKNVHVAKHSRNAADRLHGSYSSFVSDNQFGTALHYSLSRTEAKQELKRDVQALLE